MVVSQLTGPYTHLEARRIRRREKAPSRTSRQSPLSQWLTKAASPARAAGIDRASGPVYGVPPTDLHLECEAAPREKPRGRDQARPRHLEGHHSRSARGAWAAPRPGAAAPSRRPPSTPKPVVMSRPTPVAPRRPTRAPRRPRPRTTGSGPTGLGPRRRRAAGTGSGRILCPHSMTVLDF